MVMNTYIHFCNTGSRVTNGTLQAELQIEDKD